METLFDIIGIVMGLLLVGLFFLPMVAYFVTRAVVIGINSGKRQIETLRKSNGNESAEEEK